MSPLLRSSLQARGSVYRKAAPAQKSFPARANSQWRRLLSFSPQQLSCQSQSTKHMTSSRQNIIPCVGLLLVCYVYHVLENSQKAQLFLTPKTPCCVTCTSNSIVHLWEFSRTRARLGKQVSAGPFGCFQVARDMNRNLRFLPRNQRDFEHRNHPRVTHTRKFCGREN